MKHFLIAASFTIVGIVVGYFMLKDRQIERTLPIINPTEIDEDMLDSSMFNIGTGHIINDFSFLDQNNKVITAEVVKDKIWVAEYFFTTCTTICPIMNEEMKNIQKAFAKDEEVKILSFTVDPDVDTPERLKEYAENHDYVEGQWYFVSGSKERLYDFARKSVFVLKPAEAQNLGDAGSDFIHTNNFVLVDYKGRIRGYYDGTNTKEVQQLIEDIQLLKDEKKRG